MDLSTMFIMAALPVIKIFITCGFGAYLGHPTVNILTEDGRKFLNKLVVVAFTPAFVFTKLAKSVSYENIRTWWYMPINIVLCFIFGAALGVLVLKNTTIPPHLKNLVLACCAAGNTGNVPLVLVPAICEEDGNPFGRSEACSRNAVAYVSYGMWMGIALTWTVVYKILQPPNFEKEEIAPNAGSYGASPRSSDFGDFQVGGYETEEFNPRSDTLKVVTSMLNEQKDYSSASCLPSPSHQILGLLAGGIPFLKSLCEGPFLVVVESADIIGQAMIPAMNMVLGATLVQGTGASELGMPPIIGTILVRLVALPIVGMMLTKISHDLGMLPPDPLFRFVLMLQFSMPTAINVGTLSQLFGVGEKESALVLFYAYLSASVFMTFWTIIYLNYVF